MEGEFALEGTVLKYPEAPSPGVGRGRAGKGVKRTKIKPLEWIPQLVQGLPLS
jgi:hypothetical protein